MDDNHKGSQNRFERYEGKREINKTTYRKLYRMAKGGAFRSKSYMKTYARDHDFLR